jgi:hypothetical protein
MRASVKAVLLLKVRRVLRGQLKRVLLPRGQYKRYEREETKRTTCSRAESPFTSQETQSVEVKRKKNAHCSDDSDIWAVREHGSNCTP